MTSGPCQARRYPDMCRSNGQEDTQNRPARTAEVDLQPYRPPHYQGAWGIASATANAVGVDIDASDGATSKGCGEDRRPTPRRHRNPTLSQRATRRSHSGRSPRFARRLPNNHPHWPVSVTGGGTSSFVLSVTSDTRARRHVRVSGSIAATGSCRWNSCLSSSFWNRSARMRLPSRADLDVPSNYCTSSRRCMNVRRVTSRPASVTDTPEAKTALSAQGSSWMLKSA